MPAVITGLFEKAARASVVRHFVYTFGAVFALQTVAILTSLGNSLQAGTILPASDLHALVTAAMYAAGTAVLRVLVPALTGLGRSIATA